MSDILQTTFPNTFSVVNCFCYVDGNFTEYIAFMCPVDNRQALVRGISMAQCKTTVTPAR